MKFFYLESSVNDNFNLFKRFEKKVTLYNTLRSQQKELQVLGT